MDSSHEHGQDIEGCEVNKVVHAVRLERARRVGNAMGGGELDRQWQRRALGGGEAGEVEHRRWKGVGRVVGILAQAKEH